MTTAIIGTGISGLGCAYRLACSGEAVEVFEASPLIGGHTATKDVSVASGVCLFEAVRQRTRPA